MDEPHVDKAHAKKTQHIVKSGLYFRKVPRPQVLPIFPHRAQMPLNNELIAPPLEGFPYRTSHLRIRSIKIEIIDSRFFGFIKELFCHGAVFFEKPSQPMAISLTTSPVLPSFL